METITNNAVIKAGAMARMHSFVGKIQIARDKCDFKFMDIFNLEHLEREVQW